MAGRTAALGRACWEATCCPPHTLGSLLLGRLPWSRGDFPQVSSPMPLRVAGCWTSFSAEYVLGA